jgi:UTP--glucose-1-phosphate uridylyltransferase
VVGRGKRAIEDYFTPVWSFVEELEKTGKQVYAKSLRRFYSKIEDASIVYVTQPRPLGFGHAVLTAKSVVDDDFIIASVDTHVADPAPLRELAASRSISILVK